MKLKSLQLSSRHLIKIFAIKQKIEKILAVIPQRVCVSVKKPPLEIRKT
jgi:hypothetical protein